MVAREIPVDPTVPSNMVQPVFGEMRPFLSASSIIATRNYVSTDT